jgi:hypothetical protein
MTDEETLNAAVEAAAVAAVGTTSAAAMATVYISATLIVAAAHRGAIDPQQVFKLLATFADGFESGAAGPVASGPMIATILRSVEQTFRAITEIPAVAGHA